MELIDPRIDPKLVPEGSRATVIAKEQREFRDMPSVRTPFGQVITRWEPTPEERRAIFEGADIFMTVLAGKGAVQPVRMDVGPKSNGWLGCPYCDVPRGETHADWCPWKP